MKEKNTLAWVPVILVLVLAPILFVTQFLNQKDCEECITGKEALALAGSSFWTWAIIGTIVAAVAIYFIGKHVHKMGGHGVKLNVLIPVLLLLAVVWAKGCEIKADNGIGGANYQPKPKVEDGRVPAEELLQKK